MPLLCASIQVAYFDELVVANVLLELWKYLNFVSNFYCRFSGSRGCQKAPLVSPHEKVCDFSPNWLPENKQQLTVLWYFRYWISNERRALNRSLRASLASNTHLPLRSDLFRTCSIQPLRYCPLRTMTTRQTLAKEKTPLPILDPSTLPSHFSEEKEREWSRRWEESGIYQFDPNSTSPIFCASFVFLHFRAYTSLVGSY